MKTAALSEWEIAAIEASVRLAVSQGVINAEYGGEQLSKKLEGVKAIRLVYKTSRDQCAA